MPSSCTASAPGCPPHIMNSPATVKVMTARCMRCARSVEITTTDDIHAYDMVVVSANLYYCTRCARAVGYN
ncbi:hypothetical protein TD95_000114 [Thielaviopsis punctulata]|uniref:Uncharacterized protein n=1 Tax=Thielaviopsis punctulata TaxID=72032 RepID=A0A0F4Z7V5_9PEZI|nr:hypothetical protein TD95_000114 [Thielaviopsis punctulata]